jgi:hypothetical protein
VIDEEVSRILSEQEDKCRDTLRQHRKGLDLVARALLEHETIDGAEVNRLIKVGADGGGPEPTGNGGEAAATVPGREGIEIGPDRGPDAPTAPAPAPGQALAGPRPPFPPPPAPPT